MNIIQLPQAVKIMLPAIISQCVVALKDTSLGFYIVAPGLTYVGKAIYTEFQNQVQTAIVVSAIYITVNLVLTGSPPGCRRSTSARRRSTSPRSAGRRRHGHRREHRRRGLVEPLSAQTPSSGSPRAG